VGELTISTVDARAERPFPPGRYPVLIVGSGPGGLQLSYSLTRLGVEHAIISSDDAPGGMFRRWPVFQRMLSWTKPLLGSNDTRERTSASTGTASSPTSKIAAP
jgi:thioredoxin reductase